MQVANRGPCRRAPFQGFSTPFEMKFPLFSLMGGEGVNNYFEDDVVKRNDKATKKERRFKHGFFFFNREDLSL